MKLRTRLSPDQCREQLELRLTGPFSFGDRRAMTGLFLGAWLIAQKTAPMRQPPRLCLFARLSDDGAGGTRITGGLCPNPLGAGLLIFIAATAVSRAMAMGGADVATWIALGAVAAAALYSAAISWGDGAYLRTVIADCVAAGPAEG
ncbi:MAG: hypothetical protein JWM33_2515 [Caulobacteraceae bacterium]|nr:hypothetical protein [Caulobacteraceae bacterium]